MAYVILFLAGVLLCNSLPHLVSGVRGERFYTPWSRLQPGRLSSAIENVLWGSLNLFGGLALLRSAPLASIEREIAFAAGFVIIGVALAIGFARRRARDGLSR